MEKIGWVAICLFLVGIFTTMIGVVIHVKILAMIGVPCLIIALFLVIFVLGRDETIDWRDG